MELPPGRYRAEDLLPGMCFCTSWITLSDATLSRLSQLTGQPYGPGMPAPPLLVLALLEGAKQAGPVQLAATGLRGWQLRTQDPVPPGTALRGRYSVAARRGRLLTLDLDADTRAGTRVLSGRCRLIL